MMVKNITGIELHLEYGVIGGYGIGLMNPYELRALQNYVIVL